MNFMWSISRCFSLPLMPTPPFLSTLIFSHPSAYSLPIAHIPLLFSPFCLLLMKAIPPTCSTLPSQSFFHQSTSSSFTHSLCCLQFSFSLHLWHSCILLLFSSCRMPASPGSSCLILWICSLYLQIISLGGILCVLSTTVLSNSSSDLEWIRMGGGWGWMLWLVANRWPIGMSTNSYKYEGMVGWWRFYSSLFWSGMVSKQQAIIC